MADQFSQNKSGLDSPASDGSAVTPSDATALTTYARAIYVGGAGDVAVTTTAGTDLTFSGVAAGMILPVRCSHVKATGTTATNIIALW